MNIGTYKNEHHSRISAIILFNSIVFNFNILQHPQNLKKSYVADYVEQR